MEMLAKAARKGLLQRVSHEAVEAECSGDESDADRTVEGLMS